MSSRPVGGSRSPVLLCLVLIAGATPTETLRAQAPETELRLERWLAAAVAPGSHRLLADRGDPVGWAAVVLDATLITTAWVQRDRGHDDREAYRDLAWVVARGGSGPRLDGDFDFYERMGKWRSSGAFDADPTAPGIQPEARLDTFSGDAWRLARSLFLGGAEGEPGSPGWEEAVAWYAERAYDDRFTWDWTGVEGEQDRYRDTLEASDDHLRTAGRAVAALVGLRFLAVVDQVIRDRSSGRVGVDAAPAGVGFDRGLRVDLAVRWHRGGGGRS